MSQAWLPQLFAWIVPLMGGDFAVRQWHHMMMWFFIIFSIDPRLPRLLPRLRRGPRRHLVDGRRLEVRRTEAPLGAIDASQ